jgi:hypothetical protein
MSRVDPKVMAQERMLGTKLDAHADDTEAKLANARALAGLKAKAITGDKTAQQAIVGYWKQQMASGAITEEQYVAEISNLQNAITAAKVQPGNVINPNVAPNVLQPKPAQEKYTPGSGAKAPALPSGWTMK